MNKGFYTLSFRYSHQKKLHLLETEKCGDQGIIPNLEMK